MPNEKQIFLVRNYSATESGVESAGNFLNSLVGSTIRDRSVSEHPLYIKKVTNFDVVSPGAGMFVVVVQVDCQEVYEQAG